MNKANDLTFQELAGKLRVDHFKGTLICFDPGETTGLAIFKNGTLAESNQLETKTVDQGSQVVHNLFRTATSFSNEITPTDGNRQIQVVMEDYKIYGWKTDTHAWAALHTPKFIGAIIALCYIHNIPYHLQMAQQAKSFCTDDKLKQWGFYNRGMRHARDAIRHGAYYTLFNKDIYTLNWTDPQNY